MENDVIALLDILDNMISEARGMPLAGDKCIVDRDRIAEIITDIKNMLPAELAEAKRLVAARDEFIGAAKRDAEALRKSTEEKVKVMIEEQEIVREARSRSADMIASAEGRANDMRRMASEYVEQIMKQAESNLKAALSTVESTHSAFSSANAAAESAAVAKAKPEQPVEQPAEPKDDDFSPVTSATPIIQQDFYDEE